MEPNGVEPFPLDFQSSVRTGYTKAPYCNFDVTNITRKHQTIIVNIPKAADIQNGDNTHHQDQVITPQSLRTINVIPKSPDIPIPELVVVTVVFAIIV